MGTALGFVIAIVLIRGLICPWYVCRLLNIRTIQYYVNCLLRPWLILGTLTLAAYGLGVSEFVNGWLALISGAIMAGIVYLLCTYLLVLKLGEKRNLKNYIGKRIGQLNVG